VPLVGVLVFVIGRHAPVSAQVVAAYAISWLLLLSGVRGILVRGTQSGDGDTLSDLTSIPKFVWFLTWLACTVLAVGIGGKWMVMRS